MYSDRLRDFLNYSVGFDSVFRSLEYFNQNTAPYPHFDVIKVDDKNYVLEMALAGYSKDSISVTVDSNILTVEGGSKEDSPKNYVRKGIAKRHFIKNMNTIFYSSYFLPRRNFKQSLIRYVDNTPDSTSGSQLNLADGNLPQRD